MGEQEPKITRRTVELIDVTPYMGTVSEPTFDERFTERYGNYVAELHRLDPEQTHLHDDYVTDEDFAVAAVEVVILARFTQQKNIIDYMDIGGDYLFKVSEDETLDLLELNRYNKAWVRFIKALDLQPRSRTIDLMSMKRPPYYPASGQTSEDS